MAEQFAIKEKHTIIVEQVIVAVYCTAFYNREIQLY